MKALESAFKESLDGRSFLNVSPERIQRLRSISDVEALLTEFTSSLECSLLLTEEGREVGRKFKLLEQTKAGE